MKILQIKNVTENFTERTQQQSGEGRKEPLHLKINQQK